MEVVEAIRAEATVEATIQAEAIIRAEATTTSKRHRPFREQEEQATMIDYKAIRLVHRVETVYSDSETHRRLEEVRYPTYPDDPRCKALARAVNRKSNGMNDTEQAVLADFPEQGIDLGFWSRALTFSPAVADVPVKRHAAIVCLVRQGRLGICIGTRDGKRVEILARLN